MISRFSWAFNFYLIIWLKNDDDIVDYITDKSRIFYSRERKSLLARIYHFLNVSKSDCLLRFVDQQIAHISAVLFENVDGECMNSAGKWAFQSDKDLGVPHQARNEALTRQNYNQSALIQLSK
jgi:hypothetical protein